MSTLERYAALLDAELRSEIKLDNHGFIYSGVAKKHTAALGNYLGASFTHPRTHRQVTISYFPEPSDPRAREALCVHVGQNAEDAHSDTFTVEKFLKHSCAPTDRVRELELAAQPGSPSEKIRAVLAAAQRILESDLLTVINGKEWVHVPVDWGDYR